MTKNKKTIRCGSETIILDAEDVIYCKCDNNYTNIYAVNKPRILCIETIKKVEELLWEDMFLRCHQSYIVNFKHIEKINSVKKEITLSDGNNIYYSCRKRKMFEKAFNNFLEKYEFSKNPHEF